MALALAWVVCFDEYGCVCGYGDGDVDGDDVDIDDEVDEIEHIEPERAVGIDIGFDVAIPTTNALNSYREKSCVRVFQLRVVVATVRPRTATENTNRLTVRCASPGIGVDFEQVVDL